MKPLLLFLFLWCSFLTFAQDAKEEIYNNVNKAGTADDELDGRGAACGNGGYKCVDARAYRQRVGVEDAHALLVDGEEHRVDAGEGVALAQAEIGHHGRTGEDGLALALLIVT